MVYFNFLFCLTVFSTVAAAQILSRKIDADQLPEGHQLRAKISVHGGRLNDGMTLRFEDIRTFADLQDRIHETQLSLQRPGRLFASKNALISVEVESPHVEEMLVVDLPGYIRTGNEDEQDNWNLLKYNLRRKNSIILGIQSCTSIQYDGTRHQIHGDTVDELNRVLRELNPHAKVLMVLTKPDLCSTEQKNIKTLRRAICPTNAERLESIPSQKWYVVRNPPTGTPEYNLYRSETSARKAFRQREVSYLTGNFPHWSKVAQECPEQMGSSSLREEVMKMVKDRTQESLSEISHGLLNDFEQQNKLAHELGDETREELVSGNELISDVRDAISIFVSSSVPSIAKKSVFNRKVAELLATYLHDITEKLDFYGLQNSDGMMEKYKAIKSKYVDQIACFGYELAMESLRKETTAQWEQPTVNFVTKYAEELNKAVMEYIRGHRYLTHDEMVVVRQEVERIFRERLHQIVPTLAVGEMELGAVGRTDNQRIDQFPLLKGFLVEASEGFTSDMQLLQNQHRLWYDLFVEKYEDRSYRNILQVKYEQYLGNEIESALKNGVLFGRADVNGNQGTDGNNDQDPLQKGSWGIVSRKNNAAFLHMFGKNHLSQNEIHALTEYYRRKHANPKYKDNKIKEPIWFWSKAGRARYAAHLLAKRIATQTMSGQQVTHLTPIRSEAPGTTLDVVLGAMATSAAYLEMATYRLIQNVFSQMIVDVSVLSTGVYSHFVSEGTGWLQQNRKYRIRAFDSANVKMQTQMNAQIRSRQLSDLRKKILQYLEQSGKQDNSYRATEQFSHNPVVGLDDFLD